MIQSTMLDLHDFVHMSQVDTLIEQLAADGPGLILVAGSDAQAALDDSLPSGRAVIFRILMRHILLSKPDAATQAIVVAESQEALRAPRQLKRQIKWAMVKPPFTYAGQIASAAQRKPDVLVIDRLDAQSAPAALQAAQSGLKVLAQIETMYTGASVALHLLDWKAPRELLGGLTWIVTVRRLPTLCPRCKQPAQPDPSCLAELRRRYPNISLDKTYSAAGCVECNDTGRAGEVMAFDILRASADLAAFPEQFSQLPMEEYILRLAAAGHVPLEEAMGFHAAQLRRAYRMFTAAERDLAESKVALERKLAHIEAANQVLQQRTEALFSLQGISQTMAALADVDDLAARVCRYTHDLCGADRAILYFLQPDGSAEVLAVSGWDAALVGKCLNAAEVMSAGGALAYGAQPAPFAAPPPGVIADAHTLKAGLRAPLIAQNEVVGLMIVHATHKPGFTPGEVAMLQAFANQSAVALQRAGLIDALRDKIAQLEAAQAELVTKERLERELELARQVQQRLLPRIFPLVPGFAFAARCEPARRVGGDFYDVILQDAGRFGVVIADVSDKGMPAALFMALTRSLLLAEARRERSPRVVLTNVHRLLVELGQPNMFVTVFYGVVDAAARRLTYTRAGHDRPLLLRADSVQPLGGEGAFLGFLDEADLHLSEEQLDLRPGDRLVLYTDGLVDALSAEGRLFELSRLMPLLQSRAELPAEELCAATFAALAAYQGQAEQYDDMTMLVVEVK